MSKEYTWLSTQQAAELEQKDERSMRRNKEKYKCHPVRGTGGNSGIQYEFALESLSQPAQDRYQEWVSTGKLTAVTDGISPIPGFEDYLSKYTGKQREEADHRADIVLTFQKSGLTADKFIKEYNALDKDLISAAQLYYWQRKYNKGGVEALIDNRGGHNRGECGIPEEAWKLFLEYRLVPQKRSTKLCYDLVKRIYPDLPSVSTFERKFKNVQERLKVRAFEGEQAFKESFPHQIRDYSFLKSNETWCLDHHESDVLVRNKEGHIVRLWITVAMDVRSRKIISCVARDAKPNKIAIKKGLRIGFERYGIPDVIQTDNGKDYLSADLDPDVAHSLLKMLGIGKIVSLPYHGQAKPVERFFGTFGSRFEKRFYSYIGSDGKNRPDYLNKPNEELENDPQIPSMDEYISLMNNWIENEYAIESHSGDSMDKQSPNDVYLQNLDVVKKVKNPDALRLLCGEREERVVRNNGIEIHGRFYTNKSGALDSHRREHVYVCFDPDDFETLYIFNMDLKFICSVESVAKTMWRDTTYQDVIDAQKRRKAAKKALREQTPASRLSITETVAQKQLAEKQFAEQMQQKEQIDVVTQPYTEAQKAFEDTKMLPGRKENIFVNLYNCYKEHA